MPSRSALRSTSIDVRTGPRRLPALVSAALVAAMSAPALAAPALADAAAEADRRAYLAAELTAARTHALYLVLDRDVPSIDLKADGIVLRRFLVKRAEFGEPRIAGKAMSWPAASFALVSELPEPDRPRVPIPKPAGKEEDAGAKPSGPLPVEKIAKERAKALTEVPKTYRLKFSPDLVLVVRGEPRPTSLGSRLRRLGYTLLEGWEGFIAWSRTEPIPARVVVYLAPEDARRLFQALAPEIHLVIAAPPPAGGPPQVSTRGAAGGGAGASRAAPARTPVPADTSPRAQAYTAPRDTAPEPAPR